MDRGLARGARAPRRTAPCSPTDVEADVGRYPPEVEAAVYFCCLEALQNAGKHAGEGARVTITRRRATTDELRFEVADDGAGFDAIERAVQRPRLREHGRPGRRDRRHARRSRARPAQGTHDRAAGSRSTVGAATERLSRAISVRARSQSSRTSAGTEVLLVDVRDRAARRARRPGGRPPSTSTAGSPATSGCAARIRRVASMPLMPGRLMSISTRSGALRVGLARRPPRPISASPATSKPGGQADHGARDGAERQLVVDDQHRDRSASSRRWHVHLAVHASHGLRLRPRVAAPAASEWC